MKLFLANVMQRGGSVNITTTNPGRRIIGGKVLTVHEDAVEVEQGGQGGLLVAFAQIVLVQVLNR